MTNLLACSWINPESPVKGLKVQLTDDLAQLNIGHIAAALNAFFDDDPGSE